jgi:alpha-D-xyloside xylohydrolase
MMRPLAFDFPNDPSVYDIPDQFLFGSSLLVNPVTHAGASSRSVYLPKNHTWFDWWTGKSYLGGRAVVLPAPIDSMPLLVRSGSIIPLARPTTYTGEKPWDPLTIKVFPGEDASFTLYEDEGDNYNYEKGKYSTIEMHWNNRSAMFSIGDRQGSYAGMLKARTFRVELLGGKAHNVKYTGKQVQLRLGSSR